MVTFKEMAEFMDPVEPPNTLQKLNDKHRWASGGRRVSLREIARRHTSPNRMEQRLLTLNTFLMNLEGLAEFAKGVGWVSEGVTLGQIDWGDTKLKNIGKQVVKPLAESRATEIGQTLKERHYDIAALQEVFEEEELKKLLGAWHEGEVDIASGIKGLGGKLPGLRAFGQIVGRAVLAWTTFGLSELFADDPPWKSYSKVLGSGLLTISQNLRIPEDNIRRYEYENEGGEDEFARKGVLLAELIITFNDGRSGSIDLASTHLNAAGKVEIRNEQIQEMMNFLKENRKRENVLILVGDFNVKAGGDQYDFLKRRLDELDLYDLWERNGNSGPTVTAGSLDALEIICPPQETPDEAEFCSDKLDSGDLDDLENPRRVDYIFVENPTRHHKIDVDFVRPRRVRLTRTSGPQRDFMPFVSDHLGIETRLLINPR